jgi:hypothetical protein
MAAETAHGLRGSPHLLRDASWRIAEQARAAAITWHPFRVPLHAKLRKDKIKTASEQVTPHLRCVTVTQ